MKPLKSLVVEDSNDDALLLLRHLSGAGYDVQSTVVQTPAEMKAALDAQEWDVILSDYVMPNFNGLDALRLMKENNLDIPFIIISGTIGEDVAVEAMLVGVHDYLMKDNLTRLAPAIEREILNAANRRARLQAEKALQRSETSLVNAQRIAHIGNWEWDVQNNQLFWSEETYRIFGLTKNQFEGTFESFLKGIHPEDLELVQSSVDAALVRAAHYDVEHRIVRPDGNERIVCEIGEVTFAESGEPLRFIGTVQDITERKRAEQLILENEEKYRIIVETANEGIWLADVEARTTYVNRQMAEMLGYEIDEMIGRPLFDFIFKDDFSVASEKIEQRKQDKSETGEFRLRRKDGSEIITLYNASLIKNHTGEIIGFLSMNTDITERKSAERLLRQAETNYRNLVELSPAIVYLAQPSPPFSTIYVSPNVTSFGYSSEEWFNRPDMWVSLIHEEDRTRVLQTIEVALRQGLDTDLEYRIISRDGAILWLHDKGRFVSDEQGNRVGWQGVMVDITDTKLLEEQLRQSQKLESVGRLAGGIAHDFNNMLTAINGYSELTLRKLAADNPLRHNIEEIKKAGERSALLTHQLLAFSRRQVLQPVVLDLNEVITDTIKLLQRLIGEDVELVTALKPKTGRVNVDPGQLSQIILNLAVNARDAMPSGGKLVIETANIFLEPDAARQKVGILPGAYVMLAVCDTGGGMNDQIRQHIFEPFFTTKPIGKGTGLGLATVYGIVKQSGGNIEVDSEEGVGTTFRVYLPRVAEQSETVRIKDTSVELPRGTESILLVEDEELVRNLSREILETCGYMVIEARDGLEALGFCEAGNCKIDLLMTDVVMPQIGGRELAERLKTRLPNLRILFTSGYTDDAVVHHGVNEINANFIQKPYTFDDLARKVRELLDG